MIWGLSGAPLAFSADLSMLGGREDGCLPFSSLSFQICEEPKPSGYCLAPGKPSEPRPQSLVSDLHVRVICHCVWLLTCSPGQLVRDPLGSAPTDRALGPVAWEGHSAWKALGPMPWFGKWVRPLAWGVLEQGHVALARLGSNGRNGENRRGGGLATSFPQLLLSWGGPSVVWKKQRPSEGLEYPFPS